MRHLSRYVLMGLLTGGMVVDTAAAGRLFRRSCCCKCAPVCHEACSPAIDSVSSPVVFEDGCGSPLVDESLGIVESGCQDYQPALTPVPTPVPTPEPIVEELIRPSYPAPAEEPTVAEPTEEPNGQYSTDRQTDLPSNPDIGPPAPLAVPEASPKIIPGPTPPTVDTPPVVEPAAESVLEEPPLEEPPVEHNDLFDEPTPPEPTPTEEAPPEPAAEPEPTPEDDSEDLFGGLALEEEKAEAMTEIQAPRPVEVEQESIESKPQLDLADDLFGPSEENATSEELEKLNLSPITPQNPVPAIEPVEEPEEESDLFGTEERAPVLKIAGGLKSDTARVWSDSTATFRCEARLVDVSTKHVTLQKSTGVKILVPLSRLGGGDLEFVHEQVVALRVAQAQDAAAEKLAVAWAK